MRKITTIITTGCILAALGLMTACGSAQTQTTKSETKSTSVAETTKAEITGGYTANTDITPCIIPENAETAFDNATAGLTAAYEALSLLGTQVVAGTNYSFLSKVTDADASNVEIITVYEDLEGNCEITSEKEISLPDLASSDDTSVATEELMGGWTVNDDAAEGADIGVEAQEVFDEAMNEVAGSGYEPIAVLGTQVVNGTNYAILCKGTLTDEKQTSFLAVVFVNSDSNGDSSIMNIANIDLADYTE